MPRCQWCRQESQDENVCDWCKRPLAVGWTPTAAAPSDKMTFNQAAGDEPQSDRLLMISMLGIVVLTVIAFGISYVNRKPQPMVQPAAAPIQVDARPIPTAKLDNTNPIPAPQNPMPDQSYTAPPSQPQYDPTPPVQMTPPPERRVVTQGHANPKLNVDRDVTTVD
jgi:hypothetical protein